MFWRDNWDITVLDYVTFAFHRSKMMTVAQQTTSTKIVAKKLLKKPRIAAAISISNSNSITRSNPSISSGQAQYTEMLHAQVAPDATI